MKNRSQFTRREFLKWGAAQMAVLALPPFLRQPLAPSAGPVPSLAALPVRLQSIISQVPPLEVSQAGVLSVFDTDGSSLGAVPMMRTQWNLERSTRFERLDTTLPWAIVVHWFGNLPEHELDVSGYLRGFDGMRKSGEDVGRTSAHFLVGEGSVSPYVRPEAHKFGILQTQAPDVDGIPFAAAHLNGMRGRRAASDSYFVHALERLYHEQGNSPTILNHLSRSPSQDDWNYQTLAIELTGSHFDLPGHWPRDQQIANLVGLLCALMLRYHLPASSVLGHLELDPAKSDPGKSFMALVRLLIGVYALLSANPALIQLVFGAWTRTGSQGAQPALAYFKFLRDYLVITARPDQVYAWESLSAYWLLIALLEQQPLDTATALLSPIAGASDSPGDRFLMPEHHEGVDLFPQTTSLAVGESLGVQLVAPGEVLFSGPAPGYCPGMGAIFRHTQPDGAQFISVYAHLTNITGLSLGQRYPAGMTLGAIERPNSYSLAYLHFAVAFGAAWETVLSNHPTASITSTSSQILTRYLDPVAFLNRPLPLQPQPTAVPVPGFSCRPL